MNKRRLYILEDVPMYEETKDQIKGFYATLDQLKEYL